MKISFIIPVFNAADSISSLLDDLSSGQRRHTFDYEIILVDDRSTDNSAVIVQNFISKNPCYPVSLLRKLSNSGNGRVKNLGIQHAKGEIVFFIDDHCSIKDPDFIQKVGNVFVDDRIDGVCGDYFCRDDKDWNIIRDMRRKIFYGKAKFQQIDLKQWTTFSIVLGGFRKKIFERNRFPENWQRRTLFFN